MSLVKIDQIPAPIYELKNLKPLNAYSKKVIPLNAQIQTLKQLEVLYLNIDLTDRNTLAMLSKMKGLKTLSVWKLSDVPEGIEKLSFLEALTINKSKLNKEEQETLKKLLPNTKVAFII